MSDSLKWCAEHEEEEERREEEERLARWRERTEKEQLRKLAKEQRASEEAHVAAKAPEASASDPVLVPEDDLADFIARYKVRILAEALRKMGHSIDFPRARDIESAVASCVRQDVASRELPKSLPSVTWAISVTYGIHDELIYECTPAPLCGKPTKCVRVNACFLFTTEFPADPARKPVATADYDFMHGWLTHALKVSEP